jgi:anaerobic ribonucleoside-triphosphate reductase activating protein
VQGCSIHCKGCAVPWTWDQNGGEAVDVDTLFERITSQSTIEGVTFLGGEPFDQAQALAMLGQKVQEAGLSVMAFSGYTLEHLRASKKPGIHDLLAVTDLLIDGPFRQDLLDLSRPWVGSSNQRYHFLTERYRYLEPHLKNIPNRLEVRLVADGTIAVNGMATLETIKEMFENLAQKAGEAG